MDRKIFLAIFIVSGFVNCISLNPQNAKPLDNPELIKINVDRFHGEKIYYSNLFNNVKLVPLETTANSMIGYIQKVRVYDNHLFVLDRFSAKSLFIFTIEGKFVRKIGRIGKGPGEYLRPDDFCYDIQNKRILILDSQLKKINIYGFNGKFIEDIRINIDSRCTDIGMQNGYIYINNKTFEEKKSKEVFLLNNISLKGEIQKKWFKFPEYGWNSPSDFNFYEFFQTGNDLKYSNLFINTIYRISQNDVYPFITLTSENIISTNELNYLKENSLKQPHPLLKIIDINETGKMWGIHNYLENDKYIYLEYYFNRSLYKLFYNLETNEIKSGFLSNDIVKINSDFLAVDNNYFIGVIQSTFQKSIDIIVNEFKLNNPNIPKDQVLKLASINNLSNPILLFYEIK